MSLTMLRSNMPITNQTDPKLAALELKQMQINDYVKIESNEFEGCRWDKADGPQKCPHIKAVMEKWNKIQMIARDDILLAKSLDDQKRQFAFYAHLMKESSAIGDYQSSHAIYTSLNCASIARLQKVLMDSTTAQIVEEHKILFDNSYKQKHLKEAQTTRLGQGSVVPLMTTILAPFVDADGMTAQNGSSEEQIAKIERQKIKIKAQATSHFEQFKFSMLASPVMEEPNCFSFQVLNETQSYNLSLAILPRKSLDNPNPQAFLQFDEINRIRQELGYDEIKEPFNLDLSRAILEQTISNFLYPLLVELKAQAKEAQLETNLDPLFAYVAKSIAEHPDDEMIESLKNILPNNILGKPESYIDGLPSGKLFSTKLDELKGEINEFSELSALKAAPKKISIISSPTFIPGFQASKKQGQDIIAAHKASSIDDEIDEQFRDSCVVLPEPTKLRIKRTE